jgi:hypothetical protein
LTSTRVGSLISTDFQKAGAETESKIQIKTLKTALDVKLCSKNPENYYEKKQQSVYKVKISFWATIWNLFL